MSMAIVSTHCCQASMLALGHLGCMSSAIPQLPLTASAIRPPGFIIFSFSEVYSFTLRALLMSTLAAEIIGPNPSMCCRAVGTQVSSVVSRCCIYDVSRGGSVWVRRYGTTL